MTSRELCKYHFSHQSEGCRFGDRCHNSHSAKDVSCRHYAAGCCWSGYACDFSHDFARQRVLCRWYNQPGGCRYGNCCRDAHGEHEIERPSSADSNSSELPHHHQDAYGSAPEHDPSAVGRPPSQSAYDDWEDAADHWEADLHAASHTTEADGGQQADTAPEEHAHEQQSRGGADLDEDQQSGSHAAWASQPDLSSEMAALSMGSSRQQHQWAADPSSPNARAPPAGSPFCPQHFSSGFCEAPHCHLLHGLYCEVCGCYCLHPEDEASQENHIEACQLRYRRELGRSVSAQMECCICLEVVMSKPPEQRKFGLMGCDHCFCLGCIRSWRSQSGADLDTAVRTCPLCRSSTWFITPSTTWPLDSGEKEGIMDSYKKRLAGIDCKHFDQGRGRCPFGSSCFYRHSDEHGKPMATETRWYGDSDGKVSSVRPVTIASFLESSSLLR